MSGSRNLTLVFCSFKLKAKAHCATSFFMGCCWIQKKSLSCQCNLNDSTNLHTLAASFHTNPTDSAGKIRFVPGSLSCHLSWTTISFSCPTTCFSSESQVGESGRSSGRERKEKHVFNVWNSFNLKRYPSCSSRRHVQFILHQVTMVTDSRKYLLTIFLSKDRPCLFLTVCD